MELNILLFICYKQVTPTFSDGNKLEKSEEGLLVFSFMSPKESLIRASCL
jgi:hypothetical protein